MKALYITSLHRFSGKTAVCLALGRKFQQQGYQVGYFKPVSAHPWEPIPGHTHDEDADFVRRTLELAASPDDLTGLVLTPSLVREMRCGCSDRDLMHDIKVAYDNLSNGTDLLLVEGGASLREGISLGVGPLRVAEELDMPVLAMIRFRNHVSMADACVAARDTLGERLLGEVVNAVPEQDWDLVQSMNIPCMRERGINVLGVLPLREQLQAISVGELVSVLGGEFLVLPEKKDVLIEYMVVGAMSVEQALPRIRRVPGSKAVITGGDRADMQLIALETATQCLVLTGNLRPVPEVLYRAEDAGVPVILVRQNTLETVEAIEQVFGKTRLGQSTKLEGFQSLMDEHFDFDGLCKELGL
jgi:hypothetical protein